MSDFNTWEEVEKFLAVGCVSVSNIWSFWGSGWSCSGGCCSDSCEDIEDAMSTLRSFADNDLSNVKREWIGG